MDLFFFLMTLLCKTNTPYSVPCRLAFPYFRKPKQHIERRFRE